MTTCKHILTAANQRKEPGRQVVKDGTLAYRKMQGYLEIVKAFGVQYFNVWTCTTDHLAYNRLNRSPSQPLALGKQLLYVPRINPRVQSKCTSSWYSDATVMSSSCGNMTASYRIIPRRTFLQPWTEWKTQHLQSKSQPTIMKKCMLLQVYDRHPRSWSKNSGVVNHLPTSNANHRWSFADSGFVGSMASQLILSSSFFQILKLALSFFHFFVSSSKRYQYCGTVVRCEL